MALSLFVADEDGTLRVDIDYLEQFDLTKPMARADVCEQIAATVRRIEEAR